MAVFSEASARRRGTVEAISRHSWRGPATRPTDASGLWAASPLWDAAVWLRVLVRLTPAFVVAGLFLAAVAALRWIRAPGETMYPEGVMLYSFLQVRDGQALYGDYQRSPFVVAPYTPIYYYAVGLGARLGGLDVMGTLMLARALAATAALAAAAGVVAIGRRCGLSLRAAALGGGLFVTSYVLHPWAYTARPDTLALAGSLAGLSIGLRWPTARGSVAAGLLLATAFYTKQSYVVAVAALTCAMLQSRQWTQAAALVSSWAAFLAAGWIALQAFTGGLFAANVVAPHMVAMQLELMQRHVRVFVELSMSLLALACFGWLHSRSVPRSLLVVRWYTVFAAGFALLTLAKVGSYYNYILELAACLAVLAARGLDRLTSVEWAARLPSSMRTGLPRRASSLAVIAAVIWVIGNWTLPVKILLLAASSPPDSSELVEALRQGSGEVLAERAALAALLAGKTPVLPDPYGISALVGPHGWDPSPLNELLARETFSLIVLERPVEAVATYDGHVWWPPGSRERIEEHYRASGTVAGQYLYVPAAAPR